MRTFFLITLSILSLIGCNFKTYKEKFSSIENKDFSHFKGYSITYRKGIYLISNANIVKDDKRIFIKKGFTGKIKYIKDINDVLITKSEADIKVLENILNKFDKLDVAYLSIDKLENIQFSFFDRNCHYSFLKLSPSNNLKDLNKTYFKKYKDNWYLDKECSK